MEKYIAMDVETGGIGHDKSLLSVYFELLDENFNTLDSLEMNVKPDDGIYNVTGEALRINGINLGKHDETAITYREAGTKLYEFLVRNNPMGTFKFTPVGHNVAFDAQFVKNKLISEGSWNKYVSYRTLDTGVIAQVLRVLKLVPDNIKGSLSELAKHFNIEVKNAHTAAGDVRMSIEVLKAELNELRGYNHDYQVGISIG